MSLFKLFNPQSDSPNLVPSEPGNYLFVLRKGCRMPMNGPFVKMNITYSTFKGYKVIYAGLANSSLRDRDIRNHFRGTAGTSTLRKSLGALFGYSPIPRDSNFDNNHKTKYGDTDEKRLSDWMIANLLFFYYPNKDCKMHENLLIKKFNPPLNISKNNNPINREFRAQLCVLRKREPTGLGSKAATQKRGMSQNIRIKKRRGGLYINIWRAYEPAIIDAIKNGGGSFSTDRNLFEAAGNRKGSGYSFRVEIIDHEFSRNRNSAVARDLQKILKENFDFKTIVEGKNIIIRLNRLFVLDISVFPKTEISN